MNTLLFKNKNKKWYYILLRWESVLLFVTVCVFILGSILSPYFLDPWNLSDATFNFSEKAMIALPLALLIICREIDLSVASIIALSATAMGIVAQAGYDTPGIVLTGLLVGLLCGFINGFLVLYYDLHSIVVTIATMSLFRGISYVILEDSAIKNFPKSFSYFGQQYVYWVFSVEFMTFLILTLIFYVVLHHMRFGRKTYAIGLNPMTAFYSGIHIKRHKMILFCLVGLISGCAAVFLVSRLGSVRPTIAFGWELSIITMIVLGGVSITGGLGTISGVFIAVFLMGLLTFSLGLLNFPGIIISTITGGMLIGVIVLPTLVKKILHK